MAALLLSVVLPAPAYSQWVQQAIALRPGWNAVFLEVAPEPPGCDAQFAGLPVESVWDFNRAIDLPQFVQDPSTLLPGSLDWLTWFPSQHPLASSASLANLRDGRPYLIQVAKNAAPTNWIVTGRPSLRRLDWQAGALNFVGFHVGPAGEALQDLFAGEAGLAGQPLYALNSSGAWQTVPSPRAKAGEAYWIRCQLPSQRTATIEVEAGSREGLNFTAGSSELSLRIRNTSNRARRISVRPIASAPPPIGQTPIAGPVPIERWIQDYSAGRLNWEAFSEAAIYPALPPGQEWNLRLGVRRTSAPNAPPGAQFQSLLEITDDVGARWIVPVQAEPLAQPLLAASGAHPAAVTTAPNRTGLWVGEVILKAVSQPARLNASDVPRPAGGELTFRLIAHVDDAGTTRLLQQVFLARKPAVLAPDPNNPNVNLVVEPARTLAVTDESLLPALVGPGEIAGRRISSAAFGFTEPIALIGGAFGEGTLTGSTALAYDHPLNPFRHPFHPDHNNLDERFLSKLPEGRESFTVTRQVSLQFTPTDPLGLDAPSFGDSELGGTYEEAITGIHRNTIRVRGSFRLIRVARTEALNR